MPLENAVEAHTSIKNSLDAGGKDENDRPVSNTCFKKSWVAKAMTEYTSRMDAIDQRGLEDITDSLKTLYKGYDHTEEPFSTIEAYSKFRELNVAYCVMDALTRWCLLIELNETETQATKNFHDNAAQVMGISNDFYSWGMEKKDTRGRQWNAIPVIMHQFGLNEDHAKIHLKGLLVDLEQTNLRLGLELKKYKSKALDRYVDAVQIMLGANDFWGSSCFRYQS
ncbi:hypothetical protein ABW20_dc0106188 [Dactylellina cionopaga]|nr:hypothetical protein ABW20_dc0106188 [Dactylellina cionopaga]